MKRKKILALLLAAVMLLALAACGGGNGGSSGGGGSTGTTPSGSGTGTASGTNTSGGTGDTGASSGGSGETIELTVWGAEEDQTLLSTLVEQFKAAHPEQTFEITIGVESESTAKDTILTDIEAAADVFAFANDQLADLVAAGALQALDGNMDAALSNYAGKTLADVKAANAEASVAAATLNGTMYAFPMGAGNNYFLLYDSSRITPEQAQSWDTLLEAASAAGSKVGMTLASGWYNASFFLGAGFNVDLNEDGTTAMDWNGTSSKGYTGVQVAEGMLNIAGHSAFQAIPDNGNSAEIASGNVCAIVSGSWDAGAAQTAWGDGYTAAKLPTFTVNGEQVQMGCFSGFKLMGVNAHSKQTGWAVLLAEYLTNEEAQAKRFEARQLAPTNLVVGASETVSADVTIAASVAQDAFGVLQRVSGKYWDPTKTFGEMVAQGALKVGDEAGIQTALDNLVEGATAPVN